MFNKAKIKALEFQLFELTEAFEYYKKENKKELDRLSFLLNNQLKYKCGDKPFKGITITDINFKWIEIGYGGYYRLPIFGWGWEIKAFDTKLSKTILLELNCANELINPNL